MTLTTTGTPEAIDLDGLVMVRDDNGIAFLASLAEQAETAVSDDEESPLFRGKPFSGMAFVDGLVDMWGSEIDFTEWDPKKVARKTRKAIRDYQSRNMPGLPIDARQHDHGDAAGWIVDAKVSEVEDSRGTAVPVILLTADWTSLGVQLIADKILANFSPTIDLKERYILGGSLTNWPATLDKKGIPLLSAIELSRTPGDDGEDPQESDGGLNMTLEMTQDELNTLLDERDVNLASRIESMFADFSEGLQSASGDGDEAKGEDDVLTLNVADLAGLLNLDTDGAEEMELTHLDQLAAIVEDQANLKWKKKLADMTRERKLAELSARVTGGTPASPRGIPVNSETLQAELNKLPETAVSFWSGLLETIVNHGLTEFSELGHGRESTGSKEVPEYAVESLTAALAAGSSAREFFETARLGNAEDYDLTAFTGKEA